MLRGDLNIVQRAALGYVIANEIEKDRAAESEAFKQRMLAAHPEHADGILDMFDRIENGEFAEALSDEELDQARPLDATGLDEALEQMKTLGIGLLG